MCASSDVRNLCSLLFRLLQMKTSCSERHILFQLDAIKVVSSSHYDVHFMVLSSFVLQRIAGEKRLLGLGF